jgi:uncharacterized protein
MRFQNKDIELPLYLFFKKLQAYDAQRHHHALSGDVYLQLVDVLASGYGLLDAMDLYGLCKRIWLKPYHNETHFKALFDQYLKEVMTEKQKDNKPETTTDSGDKSTSDPNTTPENTPTAKDKAETDKPDKSKESSETGSSPSNKKQKNISLQFTSATTAQNEFLETDMATVEKDIYSKIYRLRGRYTSITPRKVQQGLRSLRMQQESYHRKVTDLAATIQRVSNRGFLDKVVQSYPITQSTQIQLLIDHGGSMTGFQHLVEMLQEKTQEVNAQQTAVYYFRNCPLDKLYTNTEQTRSIALSELIASNKNTFLIVSDAGAARGRYNPERIQATQQFLRQFKNEALVWLNPVPKGRWANTSADYISALVPMFEATDIAFVNAIKQLK